MLPAAIEREFVNRISPVNPTYVQAANKIGVVGADCAGSKHHSPRPMVAYRCTLTDGSEVLLCGVCRDNYELLVELLDEGDLPWDAHRQFGNTIRELAGGRPRDRAVPGD